MSPHPSTGIYMHMWNLWFTESFWTSKKKPVSTSRPKAKCNDLPIVPIKAKCRNFYISTYCFVNTAHFAFNLQAWMLKYSNMPWRVKIRGIFRILFAETFWSWSKYKSQRVKDFYTNNVALTSMQRHEVALTLVGPCINDKTSYRR